MKLQFGIIGPAQSGKTTVFNALCSTQASVGDYSAAKAANIAIVKFPDTRVDKLAEIYGSAKTTHPEIEFIDIAGLAAHGAKDHHDAAELLKEGSFVHQLRMAQALLLVIRYFDDDNIAHPKGSIDPARDIIDMESELIIIDLVQIEKRLQALNHLIKVRPDDKSKAELALMEKMKDHLENELPLRELDFTREERLLLSGFRFLSLKPALYVLNISEDRIGDSIQIEQKYQRQDRKNLALAALCGKIEMEIAALAPEDREVFLKDMGIQQPALFKVIKKAYELLGLITFLTASENEARAWAIAEGYTAYEAAGEIHSDMQRGFIKAETIQFDELIAGGDWTDARKAGKIRLEGKEYIVQEGDVILYRFNV
jgi:GTP-binding protein YchF